MVSSTLVGRKISQHPAGNQLTGNHLVLTETAAGAPETFPVDAFSDSLNITRGWGRVRSLVKDSDNVLDVSVENLTSGFHTLSAWSGSFTHTLSGTPPPFTAFVFSNNSGHTQYVTGASLDYYVDPIAVPHDFSIIFMTTPVGDEFRPVSFSRLVAFRNTLDATSPPTVTDDYTEGYTEGSLWFNAASGVFYICQDATATAAVWVEIEASSSSFPLARVALTVSSPTTWDIQAAQYASMTGSGSRTLNATNAPVAGDCDVLLTASGGALTIILGSNFTQTGRSYTVPSGQTRLLTFRARNGEVQVIHAVISQASDLAATGAPGASTFLRGDFTWATTPGGGDMLRSVYDPNEDGIIEFAQLNLGTGNITVSMLNVSAAVAALLDDADLPTMQATLGLAALAFLAQVDTAEIAAGAVGTTQLGQDITTAGKALLDDADAAAQRATLGLGPLALLSQVSTAEIAAFSVTTAELAGGNANRLLGFDAVGDPVEIAPGSGVTIDAGVISATGASSADSVVLAVWNESGVVINAGDPITINGYNATEGLPTVVKARADTASSMPSNGVALAQIVDGAAGVLILSGELGSINTSAFSAGDEVYVGLTGGLTNSRPAPGVIQIVGTISRADAVSGRMAVKVPGVETSDLRIVTTDVDTLLIDDSYQRQHIRIGHTDAPVTVTISAAISESIYLELEVATTQVVTVEFQGPQGGGSGAAYAVDSDPTPAITSFTLQGWVGVRCLSNGDGDSALVKIGSGGTDRPQTYAGPVVLESTLTVAAAATFQDTVAIEATLDVDGAATLLSTLDVVGAVDLQSTLNVDGATTFQATLGVVGAADLQSTVDIAGVATLLSDLDVAGATVLQGTVSVDGHTELNSSLNVDGATTLQSTLNVTGKTTVAAVKGTQVTETGARSITDADSGKTIIYTGAGHTFTFTGANIGAEHRGVIRNAGTGTITISTDRTLKVKGTSPVPVDASFDWEDDGTRLWITVNA